MERENLEGLRVIYIASEILLYLWVFRTEAHDELVKKSDTYTKEEVLQNICDVLTEREDNYFELCDFLEKETGGEECTLGLRSQVNYMAKKQFAAQILCHAERLSKPLDIRTAPPFDF